ncbi:MAG: stiC, partial [Deltaproteobacteria bacterium]|nr:stiC [Deltaproteobacteria bacterium]
SEGRDAPGVHRGVVASPSRAKVAFLFTGQGAQFAGMGRRLFENEPVFRKTLERCDGILRGILDRPLLSVIYPEEGGISPIDETSFTQPALFSFEYALAELWKSWGVVPDIVLGHSVGEYTAACVAGVFSLEDGLKLIAARGRLMQALPRGGAMAAVFAGDEAVSDVLKCHRSGVAIAALNAPDNTVISGEESEVASVMEILGRRNVESQRLVVSHAFHSHLLDPMLDPFERLAREINYFPPNIPVVSNLTGVVALPGEINTPSYWRRHVRNAVRFADGARTIKENNVRIFIEIGPAATLLGLGRRCLPDAGLAWIPSLRRDQDDCRQISEALAQMYAAGGAVDWEGVHRIAPRRRVLLPTYPFNRARHWITDRERRRDRGIAEVGIAALHPFFDVHLAPAGEPDTHYFEGDINLERFPYLADYRVQERPVFPATAFSELAMAARRIAFGNGPVAFDAVEYASPLLLEEGLQARIQVRVARTGERCFEFVVSGRTFGKEGGSGTAWKMHARGRLRAVQAPAAVRLSEAEIEEIKARCPEEVTGEVFYRSLAERGNQWGPAFQGVERLWLGDGEALGLISVPEGLREEMLRYEFHPAIADACGHPLVSILSLDRSASMRGGAFVGGSIDESRIYERPRGSRFWVHARLRDDPKEQTNVLVGDLRLMDETGSVVAELRGAHLWCLEDTSRTSAADGWIYSLRFEEAVPLFPVSGSPPAGAGWVVLADRGGVGEALARALESDGNRVALLYRGGGEHGSAEPGDPGNVVQPEKLEDRLAPLLDVKDDGFQGVVHLWALDGRVREDGDACEVEEALMAGAESALVLFRVTGTSSLASPPRLWLVTCGAQRVGNEDPPSDPAQAALWGLARTFAAEQPGMWGGIVDLDPRSTVAEAAANLANVLRRPGGEDQLALRGGGRFAARLVRSRLSPVARRVVWRPDATYVITGGLGGLGLLVAGWLVGKGVRHLVLIGRTPLPPREEWGVIEGSSREALRVAAVRRLESGGAKVWIAAADVGNGKSLDECLRNLPPDGWPEVRGVVHAAGVMRHQSLQETSVADLREILHAKALGGWLLHRWAATQPLDCFVMFSSA